jgi:hypothetical protein
MPVSSEHAVEFCVIAPICGGARKRGYRIAGALAAFLAAALTAPGQINPASPATEWVPIAYGGTHPDASSDQQTGSSEGDLVGNATQCSMFMRYDDAGLGSTTAGWLGFRLRLGGDANPAGFDGAAFVGLDANLDGRLDLFIGANNSGGGDHIGLWNPGSGLNISPSTTTIGSSYATYNETSAYFSFVAVSSIIDPFGTSYDLNADGQTDRFLSFVVPFSAVVAALASQGINGFGSDMPMRLMAATATQGNSFNQDLNGVLGEINSALPWEQLGGLSEIYTFESIEPIPEPSQTALCGLAGGVALICYNRRRRI